MPFRLRIGTDSLPDVAGAEIPKRPILEEKQYDLKFSSISLKLQSGLKFRSRPSELPTKNRVFGSLEISLEFFNPGGRS